MEIKFRWTRKSLDLILLWWGIGILSLTSEVLNGLKNVLVPDLKQMLFISDYLYGSLDNFASPFNIFINILGNKNALWLTDNVKTDIAANMGEVYNLLEMFEYLGFKPGDFSFSHSKSEYLDLIDCID